MTPGLVGEHCAAMNNRPATALRPPQAPKWLGSALEEGVLAAVCQGRSKVYPLEGVGFQPAPTPSATRPPTSPVNTSRC